MKKICVLGYGNKLRQDDGIGSLLTKKLREYFRSNSNITIEDRVQLFPEDSIIISQYDIAIFIDAYIEEGPSFNFYEISASFHMPLLNCYHPSDIIGLSELCFGRKVKGYICAIKGYSFGHIEELTTGARNNQEKAFGFLCEHLKYLIQDSTYEERYIVNNRRREDRTNHPECSRK